jgi:hypothetical protein
MMSRFWFVLKAWGGIRWWKPSIALNPNNAWTRYFWAYYCQLSKQLAHFKPFAYIFGFVDITYELFKFFTPIKINPWPLYAMCMSM